MGNRNEQSDTRYRQREKLKKNPKEPYSKMVNDREMIKHNTNKVNCFVD